MSTAQDDNQGHRSHVIGCNWDKLFKKRAPHDFDGCFAQPLLRDTNPTLPHPVPTGEEALSLIKEAVAMK